MSNYENIKPYADLVHEAAEHGGVDKYLEMISDASYDAGVADTKSSDATVMAIGIGVAVAVGYAARWVGEKVRDHFVERKEADLQTVEEAKATIKAGVKEAEEAEEEEEEQTEEAADDESEEKAEEETATTAVVVQKTDESDKEGPRS